MKICFAGDVFLGGDLLKKPCSNLVESSVYNNADMRVVNLEQPISDNVHVEDKCTLYTGSYALDQLKELNINTVNLAHNHIQDKGLAAISETAGHLESAKIGHFGAGSDLASAKQPYWLTEDLAILGYCEFSKPYLKQIAVADEKVPGVNPLRLESIMYDLDRLPIGKKAILYFHWGMEHVWLPPADDISLVKLLLEDNRVVTIIGMHAHRVQGVVNHAGKQAYMCLGNFIFPNFYIEPPVQILYPTEEIKKNTKYITRMYHAVYKITYKKWRWVNRVSLILEFCTNTSSIKPTFVVQDDNFPRVRELKGIGLIFYSVFFNVLRFLYTLPKPIYSVIWKIHAFEVTTTWRLQIKWFQLRQLGIKDFLKKTVNYVQRKF
ncbi:CapA family protein [Simiduia curdlanivorans]|uniref:CapA family protein n=1 Tax=Simiduia curdlanivorans TaxID=1492769 RepID=A0ABV8V2X8_9GAMM|nr:CapA family protein [Simiduia curdlanivorans]MDN3639988.1 CapA family protein [Simiduia curdlanivorans]